MQKLSFFILIALLFTACADLKKSEQLERIDVMKSQLSEWRTSLGEFDKTEWEAHVSKAETTVNVLKKLESVTIPLDDAIYMDEYRSIQLKMLKMAELREQCLEEVKAIEKRLSKLSADINSGNGHRHKYDDFLTQEEEQLKLLESEYTTYESSAEEIEIQFPEAQNNVNRIIAERFPIATVQ